MLTTMSSERTGTGVAEGSREHLSRRLAINQYFIGKKECKFYFKINNA